MSIKVNGVEITDDEVAAELPFHQETPQPLRSACIALALLQEHPERFEAMAAERSNCPSAENGGALGQMQRGETVPEFEAALWRIAPGTIADSLIETRYGLHIIRVNRRHEGQQLPFEQVQEGIAQALTAASRDAAWRQYVQVLLGRAKIEGIDLEGADTPLVQ